MQHNQVDVILNNRLWTFLSLTGKCTFLSMFRPTEKVLLALMGRHWFWLDGLHQNMKVYVQHRSTK